jgi:hypothetical protein
MNPSPSKDADAQQEAGRRSRFLPLGAAGFGSVGLEALDFDVDLAGGRGLDAASSLAHHFSDRVWPD